MVGWTFPIGLNSKVQRLVALTAKLQECSEGMNYWLQEARKPQSFGVFAGMPKAFDVRVVFFFFRGQLRRLGLLKKHDARTIQAKCLVVTSSDAILQVYQYIRSAQASRLKVFWKLT